MSDEEADDLQDDEEEDEIQHDGDDAPESNGASSYGNELDEEEGDNEGAEDNAEGSDEGSSYLEETDGEGDWVQDDEDDKIGSERGAAQDEQKEEAADRERDSSEDPPENRDAGKVKGVMVTKRGRTSPQSPSKSLQMEKTRWTTFVTLRLCRRFRLYLTASGLTQAIPMHVIITRRLDFPSKTSDRRIRQPAQLLVKAMIRRS